MAEIDFQRRGELIRGVFKILVDHPDGFAAKSVLDELEKKVTPTEFESSEYEKHPGVRRYGRIVRFSTIPYVKAGWLQKGKGQWSVTEEGIKAFKKHKSPEDFDREAHRLYRAWKSEQGPDDDDGGSDDPVPSTTLEEAEENAWAEIEKYQRDINPYDFQRMVASLLEAMGYHVAWISPPGPDKGLDILAHTDPFGDHGATD